MEMKVVWVRDPVADIFGGKGIDGAHRRTCLCHKTSLTCDNVSCSTVAGSCGANQASGKPKRDR